jgi:hypothetical protein
MSRGAGRLAMVLGLAGGAMVVPGCAPLGAIGEVPGTGTRSSLLAGEVRSVDTRRGTLHLRDDWNRAHTLRFDGGTRVVYRQRVYPVHALERGDVVRVRVARDRQGRLWADRVDVSQSVRERHVANVRVARVSGRVRQVDSRRGHFDLDIGRGEMVRVHLPQRTTRDDARRFQRLRRGDGVRVEIRPVGRGVAELVRFR